MSLHDRSWIDIQRRVRYLFEILFCLVLIYFVGVFFDGFLKTKFNLLTFHQTFTKWFNAHLKKAGHRETVSDLVKDLQVSH